MVVQTLFRHEDGTPAAKPALCGEPHPVRPGIECEYSKTHDGDHYFALVREPGLAGFRKAWVQELRWAKA